MDDIQHALLPTLMCSAAAQGLTEDLSNMMFTETGELCFQKNVV